MAVSAFVTHRQVDTTRKQDSIAASIAQGANELSYLANDYLIYRESQQLSRWQSRFALFSNQVAALNVDRPEQQVLTRNIQVNLHRLQDVFNSAVSAAGVSSSSQETVLDPALLQVSWSRIAIQSQGLISDASRLSQLLRQQMDNLMNRRSLLIYLMTGLFGALLLTSYLLTYQRILKSLAKVQAGTASIGSGNFDFKFADEKNDEIGDLSRAFNQMTADLKTVTASKADLEHEIAERKQAEEALRAAHAQAVWLARFPEQNPNPILRASADGTVLYCNPASAKLSGWRCDVGRVPPNDLLPLVGRAMAEGTELQQDVQLGERFYIVCVSPFPKEGYANIYGSDITERKQAEEALRRSEEHFRALAEALPQIVWTADAEGGVEWFNNRWYDYTGEPYGIGQGWGWELTAHPDDMPHTLKNWQEARQRGTLFQNEIRVRSHAGQYRWFLVRAWPLLDEDGKVVRWFGTNTDIEELRQVEQKLRESEARYRTLFESMTEGFALHEILCDEQGRPCDYRFLDVNPAFERLTGLKRADLLSRCVRDVLPGTEAHWIENFGRVALTGEPVHFENFSASLGRWYEVFAYRPVVNQFAVLFTDITERKRAEEALRKAHNDLEKRVHERTSELSTAVQSLQAEVVQRKRLEATLRESENQVRFFASQCLTAQESERKRIAGELHDSISASLAATKFAIERASEEMKRGHGDPESLKNLAANLTGIITEVRRIMADLRPSILDDMGILAALNWFCREYRKSYSHIAVEKQIGIEEHEVPDSLKTPVFRISQEAMSNISKHSQASLIKLSLKKEDGRMLLTIEDNGQGFDPETVRKGLGLSSIRERAELSGGACSIESVKGAGTTVCCSWPI